MSSVPTDLVGWLDVDTPGDYLGQYWPEHPGTVGDEPGWSILDTLLTSARAQCEAFAPAVPEGQPVPENYRLAQAMQARALYRASIAGTGDQLGPDGITVTVYPMDTTVKALLRPRRRPVIR